MLLYLKKWCATLIKLDNFYATQFPYVESGGSSEAELVDFVSAHPGPAYQPVFPSPTIESVGWKATVFSPGKLSLAKCEPLYGEITVNDPPTWGTKGSAPCIKVGQLCGTIHAVELPVGAEWR